MFECVYNYSLKDNLAASKFLFKTKNKRKTNIVTLLLVLTTAFGVLGSIGAIINHTKFWFLGIISILLLACYFLVDKILLNNFLKNQQEFFFSSNLSKVTKVKLTLQDDLLTETFLIKENVLGSNKHKQADLTAVKITAENMFFVFKDENVVLIKKDCLTQKALMQFYDFAKNIIKPAKNKK